MICKKTFAPAALAATLLVLAAPLFAADAGAESGPSAQLARIRFGKGVKPPTLKGTALTTFVVKKEPPLRLEDAVKRAGALADYARSGIGPAAEQVAFGNDTVFRFRDPDDGSATLELFANRRKLFFNRGLLPYRGEEETKGLPSEGELLPAVLRHLEALGFLPPEDEMQRPTIGGLDMAVKRDDGTTSIYRKLVRVRYNRTLAGLPVEGGSRVVALVGEGGDLVSLAWNWPLVEGRKVRPLEVITDAGLRAGILSRLRLDLPTAREITVDKLDLVLFDRDGVMEPAVRLAATATYLEKVVNGRKGETRLHQQPYDTLLPVLRRPLAHYPFQRDARIARLVKRDLGRGAAGPGE